MNPQIGIYYPNYRRKPGAIVVSQCKAMLVPGLNIWIRVELTGFAAHGAVIDSILEMVMVR